jgi:cell division protein FtsW
MIRKWMTYLEGDRSIWVIAMIFSLISIVTVYSFIPILIIQNGGTTEYYLIKHAIILASGFGLMYLAHKANPKFYARVSRIALWASAGLLLVTMFYGASINQAERWLEIPVINQKFQTSDIAKLALVIYLARTLVAKKDKLHSLREGVIPVMWPVFMICGLILPQNFSTAAMLFAICLAIMYVGRMPVKWILGTFGVAVLAFLMLLGLAKASPGLLPRLDTWMARWESFSAGDTEEATQLENAQKAIYSGGIFGKGPGKGDYKYSLSQAYADFYFASFIEEFGLIGGMIIISFFLIFFYRCMRIGMKSESAFGTYAVMGIGLALTGQALINMAVPTEVVPVTGQNMPILGMGGTSIWFTCMSLGIVLSVSRHISAKERATEKTGNNVRAAAA